MCNIHLSTERRKGVADRFCNQEADDRMATSKRPTETAVDKYFEALTESYDAMIEAIKLGNERGYRISTNLLTEAQRGQREAVDLGRKIADDPTDVGGFYRALMESTTKAQAGRSSWRARCSTSCPSRARRPARRSRRSSRRSAARAKPPSRRRATLPA